MVVAVRLFLNTLFIWSNSGNILENLSPRSFTLARLTRRGVVIFRWRNGEGSKEDLFLSIYDTHDSSDSMR
jgi:predicted AAA+ superfamily ATPase